MVDNVYLKIISDGEAQYFANQEIYVECILSEFYHAKQPDKALKELKHNQPVTAEEFEAARQYNECVNIKLDFDKNCINIEADGNSLLVENADSISISEALARTLSTLCVSSPQEKLLDVLNIMGTYYFKSEFIGRDESLTYVFDENVVTREIYSELFELAQKLDLRNHAYTFSVVSMDSEKYITGAYINSVEKLDELGIIGQYDEEFSHGDKVNAIIDYYIIGNLGIESESLPDRYCDDIKSHLDAAELYADCLEGKTITVDYSDYQTDEDYDMEE